MTDVICSPSGCAAAAPRPLEAALRPEEPVLDPRLLTIARALGRHQARVDLVVSATDGSVSCRPPPGPRRSRGARA